MIPRDYGIYSFLSSSSFPPLTCELLLKKEKTDSTLATARLLPVRYILILIITIMCKLELATIHPIYSAT